VYCGAKSSGSCKGSPGFWVLGLSLITGLL